MKMRPILFSTAMVQAILDGRKTQTRRVVKNPENYYMELLLDGLWPYKSIGNPAKCPYGQRGDILWVRETWAHTAQIGLNFEDENYGYIYKATDEDWYNYIGWKWKPSIHMPFAAARIFLRIKAVRVEPLQAISYDDAVAEGIYTEHPAETPSWAHEWKAYWGGESDLDAYGSFASLWQSINGAESWNSNPWVWVIEFERISREEAGL